VVFKIAVVIVKPAAPTTMLVACVAVCAGDPLSVTFAVNETVPAVVGVPVTAPVVALIVNPAGSAPTVE